MTIRITGDTGSLDAFADKLSTVGEVIPKAAKATGVRGAAEVRKNFVATRDPYGSAWGARTRGYPWPLMRKTKALLGSVRGWGAGNLFKVGFSIGYGIFHQGGTRKMIRRMLIPTKSKGIPGKWIPWMDELFQALMAEHLDG